MYALHVPALRYEKLELTAYTKKKETQAYINKHYALLLTRDYLSIFLYVLTPEGDIRRVPGNQVLGLVFLFVSFCAMLVVLVVSERRASACLIMLSAKQGSHWYHF